MKTQIVLFFVLSIAAMGCEKAPSSNEETLDPELLLSPFFGYKYTGDVPENQSFLKSATVTKTIKFKTISGIMVFQEGDCTPYSNVELRGEGRASLMGKYNLLNTFCSDGVDPVTPIKGFLTAANGDEIHTMVTEAGIAEDNDLYQLYYIYTVLGGTGRFEYIVPWEGEMIIYANVDFEAKTWTCEGEGTLVFQYH